MRERPVATEKMAVLRASPRARLVGSAGGMAGVSVSVVTSAL